MASFQHFIPFALVLVPELVIMFIAQKSSVPFRNRNIPASRCLAFSHFPASRNSACKQIVFLLAMLYVVISAQKQVIPFVHCSLVASAFFAFFVIEIFIVSFHSHSSSLKTFLRYGLRLRSCSASNDALCSIFCCPRQISPAYRSHHLRIFPVKHELHFSFSSSVRDGFYSKCPPVHIIKKMKLAQLRTFPLLRCRLIAHRLLAWFHPKSSPFSFYKIGFWIFRLFRIFRAGFPVNFSCGF